MSAPPFSEREYSTRGGVRSIKVELKKLSDVSHHLLDAESHHKREEDVLFPELEQRGVTGPPMVMMAEHEDLRARKIALKKLVDAHSKTSYKDFASELNEVGGYLVQKVLFIQINASAQAFNPPSPPDGGPPKDMCGLHRL